MNKSTIYIMSSIEMIIGAFILSICSIVKNTLPVLGRAAFQAAVGGSYDRREYNVSFPLATTIAILLIIIGIGQLALPVLKSHSADEN